MNSLNDFEALLEGLPAFKMSTDGTQGFAIIAPHRDDDRLRYISIEEGEILLTVDDVEYVLAPLTGMFFDPRRLHSAKALSTTSTFKVITGLL